MNHALWSDRQTTSLGTILREGHDNFLFSGLGCVADGRPRSAEPQHHSCVASPERCGTRLFFGGREQSETRIVSFGQSTERHLTVNGTSSGDYDGTITTFWNGSRRQWTDYQPISDKPYLMEIGDRTSEIGDGTEWTDPWSTKSSFNQSIIPGHVLQGKKTRRREGFHRRKEIQVVLFFYL